MQKRRLAITGVILFSLFSFPSWMSIFPDTEDSTKSAKNTNIVANLPTTEQDAQAQLPSVESTQNPVEAVEEQVKTSDLEKTTVVRVVDGDTIEITSGQRVRYIGMDTPELTGTVGCYAQEAANKNKELVEGKEIEMEKDVSETDRYGRLLRYIYVNGVMVNETLVKDGYAQVATYPPDVKNKDLFLAAEQDARNNSRGLWGSTCACNQEIVSSSCTACNTSTKTMQNYDCTTYQQTQTDNSCAYLCPAPKTEPTPTPVTQKSSGSYTCNCSKTCPNMSSCAEAQYQLNVCGCSARDADDDGIACDADCQ
jgi:micrococcal nuclease